MPLSNLLKKYLPDEVEENSFMTIDVEGRDLEVLTNNWNLFVPKFILIEDDDFLINNTSSSAVWKFMNSKGYEPVSKIYKTVLHQFKS